MRHAPWTFARDHCTRRAVARTTVRLVAGLVSAEASTSRHYRHTTSCTHVPRWQGRLTACDPCSLLAWFMQKGALTHTLLIHDHEVPHSGASQFVVGSRVMVMSFDIYARRAVESFTASSQRRVPHGSSSHAHLPIGCLQGCACSPSQPQFMQFCHTLGVLLWRFVDVQDSPIPHEHLQLGGAAGWRGPALFVRWELSTLGGGEFILRSHALI